MHPRIFWDLLANPLESAEHTLGNTVPDTLHKTSQGQLTQCKTSIHTGDNNKCGYTFVYWVSNP